MVRGGEIGGVKEGERGGEIGGVKEGEIGGGSERVREGVRGGMWSILQGTSNIYLKGTNIL